MKVKYYCNQCRRRHLYKSNIGIEHISSANIGKSKQHYNYGDFIKLRKGAKVYLSTTGNALNQKIVNQDEVWAVDHYEKSTGMINMNRVLDPYPGAYCSWVHKKYVYISPW